MLQHPLKFCRTPMRDRYIIIPVGYTCVQIFLIKRLVPDLCTVSSVYSWVDWMILGLRIRVYEDKSNIDILYTNVALVLYTNVSVFNCRTSYYTRCTHENPHLKPMT